MFEYKQLQKCICKSRKVVADKLKYMLGIILLWIVVYLSGMLFCKISGEKETNQMWKHLIGFFFLVYCQGIFFFGGQLLHWTFHKTALCFSIFLFAVCCAAIFLCKKELLKSWKKVKQIKFKNLEYGRYLALLIGLFLGIVYAVTFGTAMNRTDAVVETVQTTLMTDTMNEYHPFTGQPLELGVIMSKKIITLPFWYATLSCWTGFDAVTTVWVVGTLLTMICSLLAFAELGGLLFFRDFKKTWLLLVFMELMYLSGDYYIGSAGFRQFFYGYSGEVIVATVLIPCIFCVLYRFFGPILREDFPIEKEKISWWGLLLSLGLFVGSSFFMASLAWGILIVIIAVALFAISIAGVRLTKRNKVKGEEKL